MFDVSRLKAHVDQLQKEAAAVDRQRGEAPRPLFDEQLFQSRSKLITPCVEEISHEIKSLQREQASGRLLASRTAHICDKIVAQIQAVQRELATQTIRKNEPAKNNTRQVPIHELYQDLAKHQEWERRLVGMQRDKTMMLNNCRTLAEQQVIQKEILALEGRVQRCQAAVTRIEKHISIRERQG
ncbi:primosomal replication protein [Photobacterium kagoshimensis]|uniref:primosomal replication protein n=1 Tax=Photobacterium kagoshimensis TaxID=2910242 RepID=UPI003D140428